MAPQSHRDIEDYVVCNPSDDEIEVQHFGRDDENEDDERRINDREYLFIDDDEESPGSRAKSPLQEDVFPESVEVPSYRLENGSIIRPGDTVELIDRTERNPDLTLSGDFLRITAIVEDLKTHESKLNGYRLRRCSYLRPLFDGKLNELFMLIEASEDDHRPTMVQGLQSIPLTEVLKKRNCEFTDKCYDAYDVRMANRWAPAGLKTSMEIKDWIFRHGTLICRYVHTVVFDHNSVSYSGEVRKLYRRETGHTIKTPSPPICTSSQYSSTSSQSSSTGFHSRKRRPSIEQIDGASSKRRSPPAKAARYTFGDAFCGIGGASEGAGQADLFVKWGLEKDALAMHGYAANFPSAESLRMDAHDFSAIAKRCEHGVDILHMSCPCCYWSEAHTNEGKNDQENMDTLLTVGPFLRAVKPRYATLEQAPGLLKLKKHRLWFRKLVNEIISMKYNVRWRVTDQSEYGLPQRRRRLVFLCAKQGLPLPAFPKPLYGPKDSGLPYWVTVGDALDALERRGARADMHDEYHQPAEERILARPREPVDPRTILAKCITTSGGANIHPSGLRKYTPREIAQLQGFPLDYMFTGSRGEATKQAGNAWAPVANTKYFLLLAQFLEAWDMGYIEADDDVEDLYNYIEDKGIRVPSTTRYLKKLSKPIVSRKKHPLWGSTYQVDRAPRQRAPRIAPPALPSREQRQVRDAAEIARQRGELIDVD
ncbi:S-adenosyl-L-methionine-dependent methyltransferase [Paraphaeosphaeria sporulosa]|uniref:DNA (cytosine-5-)-methyltransferase n=1 Tax=Paraphaeosphaeria sporulosa TaxID=1460663 RepID=A0A177CJQ3_9PLEO|nr:S-adenosyl-L-methionine-dependent methyltransferase [Paraphaeosphaeria sporulosa]OAG07098.1 S-adenosyl-L-methionine-dependent methyltransferase [Paraphaeosphaeria sporulosa]